MKVLILLFLPLLSFGQSKLTVIDGVEHIALTIPDAAIVDYWGRKGVLSVPTIQTMDLENKLLRQKVEFKDYIISNQLRTQEEYRSMVQKSAQETQRLLGENMKLRDERDEYREKARKRGEKLLAIGGTSVLGIIIFVASKL